MDGVLLDVGGGDGLEGAQADMEGEVGGANAGGGEFFQKLGCEVESGGGRGGGHLAAAVGVDGLVTLEVGGALLGRVLALDVRRQRHFAEAVGDPDDGGGRGVRPGRAGKSHARGPFGIFFAHRAGEGARDAEGGADGELFPGAEQAPPVVFIARGGGAEQEALDGAAGGALGEEAGGEDGGVVAKKGVARAQVVADVGENAVLKAPGVAVNDEQPRGVAARGGSLGDEALGQGVVEEIGGKRRHRAWRKAAKKSGGRGKKLALPSRASLFPCSSWPRRCSSVVEQRYRKPLVVGSIPTIGSRGRQSLGCVCRLSGFRPVSSRLSYWKRPRPPSCLAASCAGGEHPLPD